MKSTRVRQSSRIKSVPEPKSSASKTRHRILSSSSSEGEDDSPPRDRENFELKLSSDSSSDEDEPTLPPVESNSSRTVASRLEPQEEDDEADECETAPKEYFDFTQILNSQKEVKSAAELLKNDQFKKERKHKSSKKAKDPSEDVTELLKKGEKEAEKVKSKNGDEQEEVEVPKENVEIKIQLPVFVTRNKKRAEMLEAEMRRQFNAARRKLQLLLHKVGLLCCLSRGFYLNSMVNEETTQCLAMSIIPSEKFYPPSQSTLSYVEKLVKWYTGKFSFRKSGEKTAPLAETLEEDFRAMSSISPDSYVVVFVALCRVLGLKCRLVISLQPPRIRPSQDDIRTKKPSEESSSSDDGEFIIPEMAPSTSRSRKKVKTETEASKTKKPRTSRNGDTKKKAAPLKRSPVKKSTGPSPSKKARGSAKDIDYRVLSSDDDDWEAKLPNSKKRAVTDGQKKKQPTKTAKRGVDIWAEVYVETDLEWICVDVVRSQVNGVQSVSAGCTKPLLYVIAWNADDTIKDVTRRYASQWLTSVQKHRVEPGWWDEVLDPWAPRKTKMEKEENKKLDKLTKEGPLPVTISEYKDHPHFALKRHLLKFEAIFPPDAQPLGYVRKEPVYSRICVVELHSRETWMRQAKLVRRNETPYKVVKARPKWDKVNQKVIKDLPLELFGYWQTEDYMAPPAVDGKVPRNEYGNVELYKPSMIPPGTVHLQIPGLARIAKKLGVDCAPALVGWEYHGGSSHPVMDGFVVCEEDRDALLDLWNTEIDESAKKSKEKAQKRAKKNWRMLVKAVILRKRLARKYGFKFEKLKCVDTYR